jgi:hypothetical protein
MVMLTTALAIFGLLLSRWSPVASTAGGIAAAGLFFCSLLVLPFGLAAGRRRGQPSARR